ncbi:MAG TPA: secretin N-terminal domain-containing protein, partial [Gemmataceae bacterium]|nr:secretin N-terminal domain-containing protein [Gemmataceae bacterium]
MNGITRGSLFSWLALVQMGLAGPVLLMGPALADEPQKTAPADPSASADFQTIQLRYISASQAAVLLQKIFESKPNESSMRFVADDRTNSIIIRATGQQIAQVREMIKIIDIEAADAEPPRPKITIFGLRSLAPDKALEDALRLVFGKSSTGNFSVDKARKIVIVSADMNTTAAIDALLSRLDNTGTVQKEEDLQVRIVWLVNGTEQDKLAAPPEDFKEALPGLTKLGIDKPRLAAQYLVNSRPSTQFRAKGTAKLGGAPCNLSVSGRLNDRWDLP